MKQAFDRRAALKAAAALSAAASGVASGSVVAQSSTGKIIVGFAAGGSLDVLARICAEHLSSKLGKTYIVENRVGASGRVAVEAVKNAKPDGDTLLVCPSGPLTLFPFVFKNLKFDPFKDIAPVARLSTFDNAIGLGPASGTDSLQKFLAWCKANPNRANFGSSGAGTILHFTGTSISHRTGIPMTHVGYRGSAPAVTDLIAGQVPMVVAPLSDMLEHHKAGRIKIVAITSAQRSPLALEVPTCKEEGLDVEIPGWFSLYTPAGTPAELVKALSLAARDAVLQATVKERLLKMGMIAAPLSPEETLVVQRRENGWWGPLVKASGFTPED
jgi:tripartite-type tricarboxylate transporter receptor subunit TctC